MAGLLQKNKCRCFVIVFFVQRDPDVALTAEMSFLCLFPSLTCMVARDTVVHNQNISFLVNFCSFVILGELCMSIVLYSCSWFFSMLLRCRPKSKASCHTEPPP